MIKFFKKWLFPNWQPVWTTKTSASQKYIKTQYGMQISGTERTEHYCYTYTIFYSEIRNEYKLKMTGTNPEQWEEYGIVINKLNELKGIKI